MLARTDIRELLQRHPLFVAFDDARFEQVADAAQSVRLDPQQVLFQRGERARAFYVVVEGQVKLFLESARGDEKIIALVNPGQGFAVWDGPLGRLGSLVCYDLEFPEAARSLAVMGVHLLAVTTANMRPWEEFQRVYVRARAMENSLFVALCNCVGRSEATEFFGGSIIVDPYGHILAAADDAEAVLVADIDLDLIHKATRDLDYIRKRREDLYGWTCSPSSHKGR